MRLLSLIACLASTVLVFGGEEHVHYGMIDICEGTRVKYVKPGDDFDIVCKSDQSIGAAIYSPETLLPSKEELSGYIPGPGAVAERTTTVIEYEDATKGRDDGWYTCVVQHGPGFDTTYSTQKCLVIILDLCVDAECAEAEVCEPNYETGTHECTCNYGCPQVMDPVCSDTCEMYWNDCVMKEQSCKDRKARSVSNKGFCPGKVEPEFRHINQDIECEIGETVNLASGLLKDGTPRASVQWVFYPEQGSAKYLDAVDDYDLVCGEEAAGVYKITLMHCMDGDSAVRNEYRLAFEAPEPVAKLQHVCSLYPGGVIEDFNSDAHFYNLACTHALAADFMPGGDYTKPWFIYGTYDQLDGKMALMTMTFYLPGIVFEFQRGWIVHTGDGSKTKLEEGVPQDMGDSGCSVVFSESEEDGLGKRHLKLSCPDIKLEAYYDGLMAGHIKFTPEGETSDLKKKSSNIGLCFDDQSGWRTNWQIGKRRGKCKVDGDNLKCSEQAPDSCDLYEDTKNPAYSWSTCGDGASAACNELHCEGAVPTAAQKCALEQANRINCDLKTGKDDSKVDESCPKDACEWMEYVVSEGCPQDNLPFVCPRV